MTKEVKEFLEGLVGTELKESGQHIIGAQGDYINDYFFKNLIFVKKH